VVSEKEYLSAMLGLLLSSFGFCVQADCILVGKLFSSGIGSIDQAVLECLVMMWSLQLWRSSLEADSRQREGAQALGMTLACLSPAQSILRLQDYCTCNIS